MMDHSRLPTHKININSLIRYASFGLILIALSVLTMDYLAPRSGPRIVTVNAPELIVHAVNAIGPDATDDDVNRLVRAMNSNLESVVVHLSQERGWIVMNSASVLSGADDITPLLAQLLVEAAHE